MKNWYERKIDMKLIEENNGTIVPVMIDKVWLETFERNDSGETCLVVKVRGETEDGRAGTATVWLDDEIITKGPGKGKPRIDYEIETLKNLGMKNGDFDNLNMLVGASAGFYVAAKQKDGKTLYNYYLQPASKEVSIDDAKELIKSIRGRAKKNVEAIQGTPIVEEKKDDLPTNW